MPSTSSNNLDVPYSNSPQRVDRQRPRSLNNYPDTSNRLVLNDKYGLEEEPKRLSRQFDAIQLNGQTSGIDPEECSARTEVSNKADLSGKPGKMDDQQKSDNSKISNLTNAPETSTKSQINYSNGLKSVRNLKANNLEMSDVQRNSTNYQDGTKNSKVNNPDIAESTDLSTNRLNSWISTNSDLNNIHRSHVQPRPTDYFEPRSMEIQLPDFTQSKPDSSFPNNKSMKRNPLLRQLAEHRPVNKDDHTDSSFDMFQSVNSNLSRYESTRERTLDLSDDAMSLGQASSSAMYYSGE